MSSSILKYGQIIRISSNEAAMANPNVSNTFVSSKSQFKFKIQIHGSEPLLSSLQPRRQVPKLNTKLNNKHSKLPVIIVLGPPNFQLLNQRLDECNPEPSKEEISGTESQNIIITVQGYNKREKREVYIFWRQSRIQTC